MIKYAGIITSVGEHVEDREKKYLEIAAIAGEEARGTLEFILEKAESSLRELKNKVSLEGRSYARDATAAG